jgi:hypothetical protein
MSQGSKGKVHAVAGHEDLLADWKYNCTLSLASALNGVGAYRHAPAALLPGKRPGTLCTGGWVSPRADLDGCGNSLPNRDSNPRPSDS